MKYKETGSTASDSVTWFPEDVRAERYLKMINEIQDYAIILLDERGNIINWNLGAEKIKQYTAAEIIGKNFSVFYLPEDKATGLPEKLITQATQTGRAVHEGWRVRKDGTRFWGSVTITALHNQHNTVIGFTKVTRDLTDKKITEDALLRSHEQLRLSEERYHQMIAEVQDYAIVLLDVHGNIQNWNAGAEMIKGYKAAEIIGQNFKKFYTNEDRDGDLPSRLLHRALSEGKAVHEGWRVRKDGSRFWGSIVMTALHDKAGNHIGFSKVTRDLTEKKATDEKLLQYTAELEAQNKELEQFAYVASHDLQEPLRKIQTFVGMIERDLKNEQQHRKYLDKIKISAGRMSDLIKSLLNFSRLVNRETMFTLVDLNEVVHRVRTDFELLLEEKQGRIESDSLPSIVGDFSQITQLFANLIGNSLKFSLEHPRIVIRCAYLEKDSIDPKSGLDTRKDYIRLSFQDNGIGFDQHYESKIFTMFQRLHTKEQYTGTGIGLALCKRIAENHHGIIRAESTPGQGATFFVTLPIN